MCGIFGYSFKDDAIEPARRAILGSALARKNDQRGGDSWGIANIDAKKNHFDISRQLGTMEFHAYQFIEGNTILAHTRAATVGAKTIENAHPFHVGKIIGAHNGAIYNYHDLNKKYKRDCDVDSMHIFHHLNAGLPFDDLEGYGSIEWVSKEDLSKIYLCRLRNGMLSIFGIGDKETKKTVGVVWSSDDKHLIESMYCAGIKNFFPYKVEEGALYFVSDGAVYIAQAKKMSIGERSSTKSNYSSSSNGNSTNWYQNQGNSSSVSSQDKENKELWEEWDKFCRERIEQEEFLLQQQQADSKPTEQQQDSPVSQQPPVDPEPKQENNTGPIGA